jgi:hypothetical protein
MKTMDREPFKEQAFVMKMDCPIGVLIKSRINQHFATDENLSIKMNIHITQQKRSRGHTMLYFAILYLKVASPG